MASHIDKMLSERSIKSLGLRRASLAIEPGKEGKSILKNAYQNRRIGVFTSGGDAQGNVNIHHTPGNR